VAVAAQWKRAGGVAMRRRQAMLPGAEFWRAAGRGRRRRRVNRSGAIPGHGTCFVPADPTQAKPPTLPIRQHEARIFSATTNNCCTPPGKAAPASR
jgi:hypothetical protein